MFAYLCLAEVSDLDVNVKNLSFCSSAVSSPLLEAPTWMVVSLAGSKYDRVIFLLVRALIRWTFRPCIFVYLFQEDAKDAKDGSMLR